MIGFRTISSTLWFVAFIGIPASIGLGQIPLQPKLIPQVGHSGFVESAWLTHDKRFIVTAGSDKSVRLWDATAGYELDRLIRPDRGGDKRSVSVHVSPVDDKVVLLRGSRISIYDLSERRVVQEADSRLYSGVRFTDDGKRIFGFGTNVAGNVSGHTARASIHVYDSASLNEVATLELPDQALEGAVRAFCDLNANGSLAVVGFKATTDQEFSVTVWDMQKSKRLRGYLGPISGVRSVEFSPSGQRILAVGNDWQAFVWERSTSDLIRRIREDVWSAVFIGSDSRLAAMHLVGKERPKYTGQISYGSVSLVAWDTDAGRKLRTVKSPESSYDDDGEAMSYFKGTLLSICKNRITIGRDTTDWKLTTKLRSSALGAVENIEASEDSRWLLVGYRDPTYVLRTYLIDLEQGRIQSELARGKPPSGTMVVGRVLREPESQRKLDQYGSDGRDANRLVEETRLLLLSERESRSVVLWDQDERKILWEMKLPELGPEESAKYQEAEESGDYNTLLTKSGKRIEKLEAEVAAMSTDRKWLATSSSRRVDGKFDMSVRLWDANTKKYSNRLIHSGGWVRTLEFSSDSSTLLVGGWTGVETWDHEKGTRTGKFDTPDFVQEARFSPDENQVIVSLTDGSVRLYSVDTGKELRAFHVHDGTAASAVFLKNRNLLVSGGHDSTIRFSNLSTGEEILQFYVFGPDSWAAIDPEGRFDAESVKERLVWSFADEAISLRQLKERYYEPGLFSKLIGSNTEPLRQVKAFSSPRLFPKTKVSVANGEVRIQQTDRGGGFGPTIVKINGKELTEDARELGENRDSTPKGDRLILTVDIRNDPRLRGGEANRIDVISFNEEGYLSSRNASVIYRPTGEVKTPAKPNVWAIVVGTSDYHGDEIDLQFAAKDAENFARAIEVAHEPAWMGDLNLSLLTTSQAEQSEWPTKENIVRTIAKAQQAAWGDIVIVYLSGHGVNFGGENGDYYYLTSDAASSRLTDAAVRDRVALSSKDIADLLRSISRSDKQVLIVDTCNAGQIIHQLTKRRRVPSSQIRAFERVTSRAGTFVLAGCAADRVSYEATPYAQGLLTHSLLMGMRGAALRGGRFVDVQRLFGFTIDRVPLLAKGVGGIQQPLVAIPEGASFDIGEVSDAERNLIPLKNAKPLVLRTNFQESVNFDDTLKLAEMVDNKLRDLSDLTGGSRLVFIDAGKFPGAIRVTGRYQLRDGKVLVKANLFCGGEKVGSIAADGEQERIKALVSKIAKAIEGQIGLATDGCETQG